MGPYAAADRKQSSTIKQHCTPSTCWSSACSHTAVGLHPICCKSANVVVLVTLAWRTCSSWSLLPNSGRTPCSVGASSVPDSYGIVTGCRISSWYLSIRRLTPVMTSLVFAVREILQICRGLPTVPENSQGGEIVFLLCRLLGTLQPVSDIPC